MSLIPIYIYEKGVTLPETGNYFVLAKNGCFMQKDTGLVQGLVKVDQKSLPLEELGTRVKLRLPKLPGEVFWQSLTFFRRVWSKFRAEAAVVLFYNETTSQYLLHCPEQQVSGGSVSYGTKDNKDDPGEVILIRDMRQKGYKRVGTIHSHCNFSAFHSSVDTGDEAKFDGLHITIGHVNNDEFSVASSLVVNDNRFQVEPHTVILEIEHKKSTHDTSYYKSMFSEEQRKSLEDGFAKEMEEVWMPRVTEHKFHHVYKDNSYWYKKYLGYNKNWQGEYVDDPG